MAEEQQGNQQQQQNQGTQQNQQQNQQGQQNQGQQQGTQGDTKQYTQEQINSMMANEKRTARQAILKELGFEVSDDKGFQSTMAEIKKNLDAGKTQQQLDQEAKKAAETKQHEAEARAALAELKVEALSAGVKSEALDDVIVLAKAKVSDTFPIDKVLAELKTKYPALFGESAGTKGGTGSPNNPARNKGGDSNGDSLGKRLAQTNKTTAKSSYFKT